jgi:hypothetical protein
VIFINRAAVPSVPLPLVGRARVGVARSLPFQATN